MTEQELEKALTMPHWKRKYAEIQVSESSRERR